ncbi:unnamed protein product [Ascophyllum nodosum]
MNESILLRTLRNYRKVRRPDFHQPATRDSKTSIENGDRLEKRRPLSKQERAEAEKLLSAGEAKCSKEGAEKDSAPAAEAAGVPSSEVDAQVRERAVGGESEGARSGLIDPSNFFREFDARWFQVSRGSGARRK